MSCYSACRKGGAAQPANDDDDDGATQPVPASPSAFSDAETDAVETAAESLHQNMKTLEENEDDPRVMAELRRLLFQKKMHAVDGRKVQHVASAVETRLAITCILRRRQHFLFQQNITADEHVMTDEQR